MRSTCQVQHKPHTNHTHTLHIYLTSPRLREHMLVARAECFFNLFTVSGLELELLLRILLV